MKNWQDRPFEIRNLFNPAFSGIVLLRSLQGYEEVDSSGMPFSLSLLVLPLCFHKETREIILKNKRAYFIKTINKHPQILIEFPERTSRVFPFTMEGLGFAMQSNCLRVMKNGRILVSPKCIKKIVDGEKESQQCEKAAYIVGKQFAKIKDRLTIYATLGVRP